MGSFRQPPPMLGDLQLNSKIPAKTADALMALGHVVRVRPPGQNPVALKLDQATGLIQVAGDPNSRRHALAY